MNVSISSGVALSTSLLPNEGPKTIPLTLDFSAQSSYPIDLQSLQQRNSFTAVQSIYVDNSGNAQNVTFTFQGSQQPITCKARTQGYYTVIAPNPVRFTAASTGTVVVKVQLLNVPVAGAVWSTA